MQISLVTHGPVNLPSSSMNAKAFQLWLEQSKQAELILGAAFPVQTADIVRSAKRVVVSDATCAVQSAAVLVPSLSFVQNNLFCDISVPGRLPLCSWLKLKPAAWLRLSRTFWLLGYRNGAESCEQAEHRAKQAVDLLIGYAHSNQTVAVIGHPFFHSMLARELRQRGWTGPLWLNNRHWGCTTYRYRKVFAGKQLDYNMGFTPS